MVLGAMIFASSVDIQTRIHRRCVSLGDVKVFPSSEVRATASDMGRLINSHGVELAFIEFHDREDALHVEESLRAVSPNVAIIGVADNWEHDRLIRIGQRYIKVITSLIGHDEFRSAVTAAIDGIKIPGPDNIIAFIPAKGGSGASTIALNVTAALASKCGKSAILIEADLHSGPAAMYLNLNPERSVVDALAQSHNLDAGWNELITPVDNFAILAAPTNYAPVSQPSSWAYRKLLTYVRSRYEYVIFDLPEIVNDATGAIVNTAKAVYVVCTPEVPSLILARKRCAGLLARGVAEDRLQIILNRQLKEGPDTAAIAEILGYPITYAVPNDYKTLWMANLKRCLVDDKSLAGRAFESFAWGLTGRPMEEPKPVRKLFGLFPAA